MFALLFRLSDPCYKYSRKVRHLERTPSPETNQLLKNRPRKSFIENLKSNQNQFSIIFCPSEKQDCRDQNYLTNLIHFDNVRVTKSKCILNFAFCFVHHFEGLIFYTFKFLSEIESHLDFVTIQNFDSNLVASFLVLRFLHFTKRA